jgi:hypothetical protein
MFRGLESQQQPREDTGGLVRWMRRARSSGRVDGDPLSNCARTGGKRQLAACAGTGSDLQELRILPSANTPSATQSSDQQASMLQSFHCDLIQTWLRLR